MYRRPVLSSPDGNNKNSMMVFVVWFPLNLSCLFLYWWTFPKQKNKLISWQWNHMSFKNEKPLSKHHHFLQFFPERVRPKPEFSFCTAILVRGKFTVRNCSFQGKTTLLTPHLLFLPGPGRYWPNHGSSFCPAPLENRGISKTTKTRDLVEENTCHHFFGTFVAVVVSFLVWCFFFGLSDAVFVFQFFCSFVKKKIPRDLFKFFVINFLGGDVCFGPTIHIKVGILDGDNEIQGFWRPVSFKDLGWFHGVSLDCCVGDQKMQQRLCDFWSVTVEGSVENILTEMKVGKLIFQTTRWKNILCSQEGKKYQEGGCFRNLAFTTWHVGKTMIFSNPQVVHQISEPTDFTQPLDALGWENAYNVKVISCENTYKSDVK